MIYETDVVPAMGLCSWDAQSSFLRGDAVFANYFCLRPAEATKGASLQQVAAAIHADDRPELERRITGARNGDGRIIVECRAQGRDQKWRRLLAVGHCFYDEARRPIRCPGVVFHMRQPARPRTAALDKLADAMIEARKHALADGRDLVLYLLDMAMLEVGFALATREKRRATG